MHYERLNGVRFAWVDLDADEDADGDRNEEADGEGVGELRERLRSIVDKRPCWVGFHKGVETGWSKGGLKRFRGVHGERKKSEG